MKHLLPILLGIILFTQACKTEIENEACIHFDSLITQAEKYYQTAHYDSSLILFNDIHPCSDQKDDTIKATVLYYLSELYYRKNEPGKALQFLPESHTILKKLFGPNHPYTALSANLLASVYDMTGEYRKAIKHHELSISITNRYLPYGGFVDSVNMASSYNNLAAVYGEIYQFEYALKYYSKAIYLYEGLMESNPELFQSDGIHTKLGSVYNNIGLILSDLQLRDSAVQCFLTSINLEEKHLPPGHYSLAANYNNLANEYYWLKKTEKALHYHKKALDIRKKHYGDNHSAVAQSYIGISNILVYKKQYIDALKYQHLATEIYSKHPHQYTFDKIRLYESLSANFIHQNNIDSCTFYIDKVNVLIREFIYKNIPYLTQTEKQSFYSFLYKNLGLINYHNYLNKPKKNKELFNNALIYKSLILNSEKDLKSSFAKDKKLKNKYVQWLDLGLELKTAKNNVKDSINTLRAKVEKELIEKSLPFRRFTQKSRSTWKDIQKSLSKDEAVIEFLNFSNKAYIPVKDSTIYIALVLKKEYNSPKLIPLFDEKQLMNLINNKSTTELYSYPDANFDSYSGDLLYELCWSKIAPLLEGCNRIYLSKSGILNLIDFEAIPLNDTQYLAEKHEIYNLISSYQLISEQRYSFSINDIKSAALFTDINYDQHQHKSDHPIKMSYNCRNDHTWSTLNSGSLKKAFNKLTEEGVEISIYTDSLANTDKLYEQSNSDNDILQIFTHGFYCSNARPKQAQNMHESATRQMDPLYRTGLLFSGANRGWKNKNNEGIITADEIANMDFSQTKLVILSACQSGLGAIDPYEGIYGLQRAFKIAGAEKIIVTLQEVYDDKTAEFFELFYKDFAKGSTIHEAFNSAKKQMREKYTQPEYWAGYVLIE